MSRRILRDDEMSPRAPVAWQKAASLVPSISKASIFDEGPQCSLCIAVSATGDGPFDLGRSTTITS